VSSSQAAVGNWLPLAAILLLGLALRLVNLSRLPLGFFCDEASTGYDAWSLLQTGRDQYGAFLPLFARSLGDYNEALYRYLTVPSVALFGLNEFATRLPAAIVGALTILPFYGFVRRCFGREAALAAAFLLAVGPWHLLLSRMAFRAILLPFFICCGLWSFFLGLERHRFLWLSALAFGLSFYSYSSARLFTPLLLVLLTIVFFRDLRRQKFHAIASALGLLVLSLPALFFWFSPEGLARARISFVEAPGAALANYLSYFDPGFLFIGGDPNLRHSSPATGQLLFIEFITVATGLGNLIHSRSRRHRLFLLLLLLYPLPAALTTSSHALRAIIGAPVFAAISGLGASLLIRGALCQRLRKVLISCLVLAAVNLVYFLHGYFFEYREIDRVFWERGMSEAITQGAAQPFDRIYVSDQFFVPHTFILFYTRFPPEQYQKAPLLSIGQDQWDYSDFQIGRFRIHSPERVGEIPGEALYIIRSEDWVTLNDHASSAQILETVRDDLQRPLIYIVAIGGQSAPDETESQPVSDKKPAVLPESSIRQRIEEEQIDLNRARKRTDRVVSGRLALQRDKKGKAIRQVPTDGAVRTLNHAAKTRHASGVIFLNSVGQPIEEKALDWALGKA
jgi:4-amino-4-deoxy-L-arabinose transferase-like glycosyltransferase